ncbi:MAG TPA: Ig-like domain-containing protein [Bacteroidia bacterium]
MRLRKKSASLRSTCITSILFLFHSCATIMAPNGGPKDTTPPKVVRYMPDSAATNYKGSEINIAFNEYIQLKDINNQLIISPPLEEQPDIKLLKYKVLNIQFKKPLKENTTYTLNFGNSIADYNEGNVLDGFQYIFSTGSFIDSLKVSGKVQYAYDHKTEKGILVMLYDVSQYDASALDSLPYKVIPSYFTKTKPDGSFRITNIHEGKYKIFALKDINNNYKYDAESEFIGFSDSLVTAGTKQEIALEMFKETPKKLRMLKADALGYGHIVMVFNQPVENIHLKPLNVSKVPTEIMEYSPKMDSLHYWFEGVGGDSLKLQVSTDDKILDTAEVRLVTKEQATKSPKGEKLKLVCKTNILPGQLQNPIDPVRLFFNHPLKGLEKERNLILKEDTARQKIDLSVSPHGDTLSIMPMKISVQLIKNKLTDVVDTTKTASFGFSEDKNYSLFIPPGYFTDIFGQKNDTIKLGFKTHEQKYYGTLKLKLNVPQGAYVLQLLDSKDVVVKEEQVMDGKTFFYDYLTPGNYKIKLIIEKKPDHQWTPGNYLEKKQPEKVVFYSQPLIIRSDWDLEAEWKPEY